MLHFYSPKESECGCTVALFPCCSLREKTYWIFLIKIFDNVVSLCYIRLDETNIWYIDRIEEEAR